MAGIGIVNKELINFKVRTGYIVIGIPCHETEIQEIVVAEFSLPVFEFFLELDIEDVLSLNMIAEEDIDELLLVGVFEILHVESSESLFAVVE